MLSAEMKGLARMRPSRMQMAVPMIGRIYPLHAAQVAQPVVEQTARPVAHRGIDEQGHRFQSGGDESHHDRLAAERQETACYHGRYEHACVTITDKKFDEGIHTL